MGFWVLIFLYVKYFWDIVSLSKLDVLNVEVYLKGLKRKVGFFRLYLKFKKEKKINFFYVELCFVDIFDIIYLSCGIISMYN